MLLKCGLEKTPESPLDCKKIQLVNPKGNQSWIFIWRTDAEAEAPILWPPDAKNGLTRKDSDTGKDWRQEEKGTTEAEMAGWHHWLDGHKSKQASRVGDGQGSLACCSPWGHKGSDTTEWLNWSSGGTRCYHDNRGRYPHGFLYQDPTMCHIMPYTGCGQNYGEFRYSGGFYSTPGRALCTGDKQINKTWDLLGCLVLKTPSFHCRGRKFQPSWGNLSFCMRHSAVKN